MAKTERPIGEKAGLVWAVQISVVVLVILWLVPTIGLFVSSFRERDQISASGWWSTPFAVEQTFRARASGDPGQQDGVWVVEGNVFADPENVEAFPDGTGTVGAFGHAGRGAGSL